MKIVNPIYTTKIMNENWQVFVYTNSEFKRKLKLEEMDGYCDPNLKRLYFNKNARDFVTILHELKHGYISYFRHSGINVDDFEELSVDYLARNVFQLLVQAANIRNAVNGTSENVHDYLKAQIELTSITQGQI